MTGILLVSDQRCGESPADVPQNKFMCPEGSPQWGLITPTKQYSVRGNASELKKYERHRVTVTGTVTEAAGDIPIDKLEVQSIDSSEVAENELRALIDQLRSDRWAEPQNMGNPTLWLFHFTPPMIQILQAGPAAQDVLLQYVSDPQIKDHIIILLGGIGDERAVAPIIDAMATPAKVHQSAYARRVNLAANLALTNISVGDVIWHMAEELRLTSVLTIPNRAGLHGGPNTDRRLMFHTLQVEGMLTIQTTAFIRTRTCIALNTLILRTETNGRENPNLILSLVYRKHLREALN